MTNKNKNNKKSNEKFWVQMMCLFLGILMVLSIVFMVISAFKSYAHTEPASIDDLKSDTEISVGLCYDKNAAQSLALSSSGGFVIDIGNYTLSTSEPVLVFAADGNEYLYNSEILVNPEKNGGLAEDDFGVNIVGGYHISISGYRVGELDLGGDNPIFIQNGTGAGSTYSFTKDNIDEYIAQFESTLSAHSDTRGLDIQIFPGCLNGGFRIMVGSFASVSRAEEVLTVLENVFNMDVAIASPNRNAITIQNLNNDILFETDLLSEMTVSPDKGDRIIYNGRSYKGCFRIDRYNLYKDALVLKNVVSIDDYVKSCLSSEFSENDDPELLKAMAVIFRTNAFNSIGEHESDGFDVCAGNHCRQYTGCGSYVTNGATESAVDAVSGKVIAYGGKPIHALYTESANTTVSSKDAISADLPYLSPLKKESLSDNELFGSWKREYSASDLSSIIRSAGYTEIVGSIKSVDVNKRGKASLYVASITFTDIFGNELTITGSEQIRKLFGGDLPSAEFAVSKAGKPVYVVYEDESGNVQTFSITLSGSPGYFVFAGDGVGSGMGLVIETASLLASKGSDYKDILNYFYKDVSIENI